MEKPRAFDLPRFADGHGADRARACQFVKFRAAETAVKFHALFGAANPDGQAVEFVLKQFFRLRRKPRFICGIAANVSGFNCIHTENPLSQPTRCLFVEIAGESVQ